MTQAFFGVRSGVSKGRLGIYGKLRPGFVRFGDVILHITPPPNFAFHNGPIEEPGFDIGGVVIITIAKHFAARYEAGDTLILYENRSLFLGQPPTSFHNVNSFQLAAGFLFRF